MIKARDQLAKLFGIGPEDETDSHINKHQQAWDERRSRLLNRRCGKLKTDISNVPPISTHRVKRGISHKFQKKRSHQHPNIIESKVVTTTDNNSKIPVETHDDDGHLTQASAFTATLSYEPIKRTTSDTDVQNITSKLQYAQSLPYLDEDRLSCGSYDLTDFRSQESIRKLVNDVLARHQPKRAFGIGIVGSLLSRKFRNDLTHAQVKAIYSFNDHRPYFTYWVTTVQILIMIITLMTYGFGPFGFTKTIIKGTVYVSSLIDQHEAYYEKDNIWLGPRSQDLIHLGAKFTPCMRRDSLIYNEINRDRQDEKLTGCCIRKDQSSCLQTQKDACSPLATWHSWNESTTTSLVVASKTNQRLSGPVCGQDPNYCLRPASNHPHEWPDDITQWPICQERPRMNETRSTHMSCEVVGRPCCIGIYGQCRITTSEHCQFLRGTYHPDATLCSQVSCMEDVCGMIPFYAKDYPDQFYRLFTALFLHAGLIHLAFTIILQYYIMRDIERLLGSTRMSIIYILSGVAGNLASAAFVPYHSQVGPSGSQFALLACLIAETINSWKLLDSPFNSLLRLISIAKFLLFIGLLPWIDNYAHIFGFLVGLMLSLALTPYLTPFNDVYSRRKKVIQIWICTIIVILIFVLLSMPLYIFPLYKCSWCQYLDCWPLAPYWCENQDIKVARLVMF